MLTFSSCEAGSIGETGEMRAHDALYAAVAAYFRCACSLDGDDKVFLTNLPPIYLQHHGTVLSMLDQFRILATDAPQATL
jgi:hypothetical protein